MDRFVEEINRKVEFFNKGVEKLDDLFGNVSSYCEELKSANDNYDVNFVGADDRKILRELRNVNARIMIAGQMNCGKTSLINELLRGDHLPTQSITNTARKVIVKYAEINCYEVKDPDGVVIASGTLPEKQKLLKDLVDLKGAERESRALKDTVEVGLNLPLLRSGLEIIDTPGLNETEFLEELVLNGLDALLQLTVYVIDGKRRSNLEDNKFLKELQARRIKVMVVCNKIEFDHESEKCDEYSSEEEGRNESSEERHRKVLKKEDENKMATLKRLKMAKIMSDSVGDSIDYHAMSLKRVREARKKQQPDTYTDMFLDFLDSIKRHFEQCIAERLLSLNSRLICAHGLLRDYLLIFAENRLNYDVLEDVVQQTLDFDWRHFVGTEESAEMERDLQRKLGDIDPSLYTEGLDLSQMKTNPEDLGSCKLYVCYIMMQVVEQVASVILENVLEEIRIEEPVRVELSNESYLTFDFNSIIYYHGESRSEWDSFDALWKACVFDLVSAHSFEAMGNVETVSGPVNHEWCLMIARAFFGAIRVKSIARIITDVIIQKMGDMQRKYVDGICALIDAVSVDNLRPEMRHRLDSISLRLSLDFHMAEALHQGSTSDFVYLEREVSDVMNGEFHEYDVTNPEGFVARKFNPDFLKEVCRRRLACQRMVHPPKLFLPDPTVSFDRNWDLVFLIPGNRGAVSPCLRSKHEFSIHERLACILQICRMVVSLTDQKETIPKLELGRFLLTNNLETLEVVYDWLRVPGEISNETTSSSLATILLLFVMGGYPERSGGGARDDHDSSVLLDSLADDGGLNSAMKRVICKYLHGDENVQSFTSEVEELLQLSIDEFDD